MSLIEELNWRYAAKRMNGTRVSQQKLDNILDAIRLSASSGGLQPYNIIIVSNDELKKKMQAAAFNQPQLTEGSHILVFAAWDNITPEKIEEYIQLHAVTKGIETKALDNLKDKLSNYIFSKTGEARFNWAARQAYIALGTGIIAAAEEQVDATPMEGFDNAAIDELLGLTAKGLKSVVILALGYRDAAVDPYVNAPKVRWGKEHLFINLN